MSFIVCKAAFLLGQLLQRRRDNVLDKRSILLAKLLVCAAYDNNDIAYLMIARKGFSKKRLPLSSRCIVGRKPNSRS